MWIFLDDAKNRAGETLIHTRESRVSLLVIPTDEELQIALCVKEML
jgi:acetate kinase